MLKLKKHKEILIPVVVALLVVISCITFQTLVFADPKIQTAQEYRDLGLIEQKKGNMPQALSYFLKAIGLGMDSSVVLNDIAIIYEQIGLPEKAENYYMQAISQDQEYLPPYMNLAYFYLARHEDELAFQYFKKRFEMAHEDDPWAEKAKEEMLKIHPEFIHWIVSRQAKILDQELVMQAHEDFSNRVRRASQHFQRAKELEEAGSFARAFSEYEEALRLTPDNPKIQEAKRDLKIKRAKEEFQRRSEHALKMLESGNTHTAKEEIQNMLATIPNE